MALPSPEPGLVISYGYLWEHEAASGQEEGLKSRPCVIALVVERAKDGQTWVTVLPITHSTPINPDAGVEIPIAVKRHLGLDEERSWGIVSEGDRFVWPVYDLRKVPDRDAFHYGFLPPRFFEQIIAALRAWHIKHRTTLTLR